MFFKNIYGQLNVSCADIYRRLAALPLKISQSRINISFDLAVCFQPTGKWL